MASDKYLDACATQAERPLEVVAAALREPHSLSLSGQTLSEGTITCLVEGVRAMEGLSDVELSDLQLSGSSMAALTHALSAFTTVTHLSISGCALGNDGVRHLSSMLRNSTLASLVLQSNAIGNAGVSALAEVLATNTGLRTLDLQRNHVKCQGAIALAAACQVREADLRPPSSKSTCSAGRTR